MTIGDVRLPKSCFQFMTREVSQGWLSHHSEIESKSKLRSITSNFESSDDDGKTSDLTQENHRLRETAMNNGTKMAAMETELHELKLQFDEEKNKNAKLELEIRRLKRAEEERKQPTSNQIDGITQTLEMLEDLLEKQSTDTSTLSNQRDTLITLIQKLEASNQEFEQIVYEQKGEIKDLRSRISDVETEYEALADKSETRLDLLWEKISAVVPESKIDELSSSKTEDKIVELMRLLSEQKVERVPHIDRSRELQLLGHLENAVKLIKNLALADTDSDDKSFILAQCARMSKIIEEHCGNDTLPNVCSLFEKRNCEEQMKAVFDIVDISSENETPTRELLALLTAAIYINGILFSQVDHLNQSARVGEREQELIAENEKLNNIIADEGAMYDMMLDKLASYVKTPCDDLMVALDTMLSQYEQMEAEMIECEETNKELDEKLEQMKDTLSDYPANEKEIAAQKKKIQKLSEKNGLLFKEVERLKSENDEIIKRHNKVVASLSKTRTKAERSKQTLQEQFYAKLSEQAREAEEQMKVASAENYKLKQVIESLQQEQAQTLRERDCLVQQQQENEKKLQAKVIELVKRIEELETVNNDTLTNLRTRGDDLRDRYELRLEALTEELEDARKSIDNLSAELSEVKASKQEQYMTIAKLKLNERTLNLKIKQLTDQSRMKEGVCESRAAAKIAAMKTEFDAEIRREQETMENYSSKLVSLVEQAFDVRIEGSSVQNALARFESIVQQRSTSQWRQLTEDAIAIRKLLGLKKGDSLLGSFKQNQVLYQTLLEKNEKLEKYNRQLASENALMKRTQKNNEEAAAWMKWATGLYYQITDGHAPAFSADDIKYALEEAMMASIGHRTLRRRLEILRSEKRIVLSCRNLLSETYKAEPVLSLRPLTLVAMFSRRVQSMAGCLARQYRSTARSTAASSVSSFRV